MSDQVNFEPADVLIIGAGASGADSHPFVQHPHRTLVRLSLPVLVSLVAEPLTGTVDTAFVARLGPAPLGGEDRQRSAHR